MNMKLLLCKPQTQDQSISYPDSPVLPTNRESQHRKPKENETAKAALAKVFS